MLARLLFAAVALPLIGALPDAHASRAVASPDGAALAPSIAAPAPAAGQRVAPAAPGTASPAPHAR